MNVLKKKDTPNYIRTFKSKFNIDQRISESGNIIRKYPDRVPVICERNPVSKNVPDIDKHKFLVPKDLTVGQFVYLIRKRIKLRPEQALFIFINNVLPPTSETFGNIYEKFKDSDNFLYFLYSGENTFG